MGFPHGIRYDMGGIKRGALINGRKYTWVSKGVFFLNPFFCCGVMVAPTEITGFGCPFCRIFSLKTRILGESNLMQMCGNVYYI